MTQHYRFAHQALTAFVARHSATRAREIFADPDLSKVLSSLWFEVHPDNDHLREDPRAMMRALFGHSREPDPNGGDTAGPMPRPVRVNGLSGILVMMPPPREQTEAHMILITLEPTLRYFTLEHVPPWKAGDAPSTMLCEWTLDSDETHINLGGGPPPDAEAFVRAVEAVVDGTN